MAGAVVKGSQVIGAPGKLGLRGVEDRVYRNDRATILGLAGTDHTKVTYP
jgi:hypothetical protein